MSVAFNEPRYEIEVSDFRCRGCETEVPCEALYYSAVHFEGEVFQRRNYCQPCWAARAAAAGPGEVFAFWRTRRPPLPADKPRKARFDPALVHEFFRRLGGGLPGPAGLPAAVPVGAPAGEDVKDSSPSLSAPEVKEREDLRFVLALLLVRKKVLEFSSSREEGGVEWLKLETRPPKIARDRTADAPSAEPDPPRRSTHWVKSPRLDDAELERVKIRIGELLQLEI